MMSKTVRILAVDDREDQREMIRDIFSSRPDIALTEAISGDDAIEKIKAEDFDLALLDMRMPSGTEGLDVLRDMKSLKPEIQVMMMTAYGDIETAVEAMKRGALDFIAKDPKHFHHILTFKVNDFISRFRLIADRELLIREKFATLTTLQAKKAKTASARSKLGTERGKALEDLTAALFASIEGFVEIDRNINTKTEEIDIAFRNESRDPAWQRESQIILVECKNWSSKTVGKNEFVLFEDKMRNRFGRCRLGFLVCTEDFAETVTLSMIRGSRDDLLIVPINGERLRQLVETKNRNRSLLDFLTQPLFT
jgi:CheY-like chemotaxis protein